MRAMHDRFFLVLLLTALPAFAAERPNILFIMTDDHASHAISATEVLGNQQNHTFMRSDIQKGLGIHGKRKASKNGPSLRGARRRFCEECIPQIQQ
jgi:hypothetical protein